MAKSATKKTIVRTSLIDSVMTDLIDTARRPTHRLIASYCQTVDRDVPTQRIGYAFVSALNARNASDAFDFKPEPCIFFMQEVANGLVKKAKALINAANKQETFEMIAGGTGQDNFAELCTSFGIDTISRENIQEIVKQDFDSLNELHSILRDECSYMDIDRLYMYSQDTFNEETEEWDPTFRIDDLDEAMEALTVIADKIAERQNQALLSKIDMVA